MADVLLPHLRDRPVTRETIDFPIIEDLPSLVWAANLAALELHVPQWRVGPRGGARDPDLLVVDLDPQGNASTALAIVVWNSLIRLITAAIWVMD